MTHPLSPYSGSESRVCEIVAIPPVRVTSSIHTTNVYNEYKLSFRDITSAWIADVRVSPYEYSTLKKGDIVTKTFSKAAIYNYENPDNSILGVIALALCWLFFSVVNLAIFSWLLAEGYGLFKKYFFSAPKGRD